MLRHGWCVVFLCGAVLLPEASVTTLAISPFFRAALSSPETGISASAVHSYVEEPESPPIHVIYYKKTFNEAQKYCSDLCQGCRILNSTMSPSASRWLNSSTGEFWLYDGAEGGEEQSKDCSILTTPTARTSSADCNSKHDFVCILHAEGSSCNSSLAVYSPSEYPSATPFGCKRLFNAHEILERHCVAMHVNLSVGWWTSSSILGTSTAQNRFHGSITKLCNAATLSFTTGYLITPWDCSLKFPTACLQPVDEPVRVTPSSVKCYYFGDSPVGTYCKVMVPSGANSAMQAQSQCEALSMTLLNISDVTLHRLCLLMDKNHFNNKKIWIGGMAENSRSLEGCGLQRLNDTVVQNSAARCDECEIHVVCDAGFYQTSSTCATVERKSGPMEYCYYNEPEDIARVEGECKSVGKALVDEDSIDDMSINGHLLAITNYHLEYWVEFNVADAGSLSAVIAVPYTPTRDVCSTVWLGRRVPWIFPQSCSKLLPIICQGEEQLVAVDRIQDCRYHTKNSGKVFCVPNTGRYNKTGAREYCAMRNMSVLLASSLQDLRNFNRPQDIGNPQSGYVWFKDVSSHKKCRVASLANHTKEDRSCQESNPYICMGKPRKRKENCEYCSRGNCDFCVGSYSLSNDNSQAYCQRRGLRLLSTEHDDYPKAFSVLDPGYSEVREVWLQPSNGLPGHVCKSMYMHEGEFFERELDCSLHLHFLCTSIAPGPVVKYCRSVSVGEIRWPETEAGKIATAPCDTSEGSPQAFRRCGMDGKWDRAADTSKCTSSELNAALKDIDKLNDTESIGNALKSASSKVSFGGDLRELANKAEDVLGRIDEILDRASDEEKSNLTQALANSIVIVTDNAMGNGRSWYGLSQGSRLETANKFITNLETSIYKMLKYNEDVESFSLSRGNLTVEVAKKDAKSSVSLPNSSTGSSMHLPENFATGKVDVIYAEYPALGEILGDQKQNNDNGKVDEPFVGTPVVTVTVLNNDQTHVTSIHGDVTLVFKNLLGNNSRSLQAQCAFIANGNGSKWDTTGCKLSSANDQEVVCTCDHLTNFAVLMSAHGSDTTEALEWITNIGCGISIVCLALCIIVFTAYRQLRGIRNTIHRNLCASLLLAEILMILAMDKRRGLMKFVDDKIHQENVLCTVVACILHFLFLSAFCWMALEGCHIILLLWKVFNSKRTYYERYYIVGYGIPLIIVSIALGVGYESYVNREPNDFFCWIPKEHHLRLSFIVPVLLVISINIGALGLVLWKMSRLKQAADKSTAEKVRHWVRGTFVLLPLLGVTWLLGLGLWEDAVGVMAYAFAVLNSLQGVGIFVCHVLMSKKARDLVRNSFQKTTRRLMTGSQMSRSSRTSANTTWYRVSSSANSTSQSTRTVSQEDALKRCSSHDDSMSCADCLVPRKFRFEMNLNSDKREQASSGSDEKLRGLFFRNAASEC